jgi:hypothetical protein
MRTSASRYALILAGVTVIIIYASLYPFDFSHQANTVDALKDLLSTWRSIYSWGMSLAMCCCTFPLGSAWCAPSLQARDRFECCWLR